MSDEKKELTIEMAPQVQEQVDNDPELAKALKEFVANLHQANHAVKSGQYASLDDAMEAITGSRPVPVDLGDEGTLIADEDALDNPEAGEFLIKHVAKKN